MWSPWFFGFVMFVTFVFFWVTVFLPSRYGREALITRKQGVYFVVAMITLYAVKGSPVDLFGHIMFSAHMTQMAILYLIIPPLLIRSIPNALWMYVFQVKWLNKFFRFFTKPIMALLLFNVVFSVYHIPMIFDAVKISPSLHITYTIVLFMLAMFMWWPLWNTYSEEQQLTGIKKVGYIFASGVLLTPACALIIFADTPLYGTYSNFTMWTQAMALCVSEDALAGLNLTGPELFNTMPLVDDQQLGGVLMKIIQEVVYGIILAKIFFEWFRKETEKEGDPILSYDSNKLVEE